MNYYKKRYTLILLIILICASYYPPVIEGDDAGGRVVISSFATSVAHQSFEVRQNISVACSRLDGMLLAPGKVFSFNETVGEGSPANGFSRGQVLYMDETRMEPGGGLCQVSSTLFNALLVAGFRVVERHRHYQPVSYVPLGLDATIKYGKKDLRMRNPHNQTMRIVTYMNEKSLVIKITGDKRPRHYYRLYTEEEELEIPFAEKSDAIRKGLIVYVYRKKFRGKRFIESFLVHKDFYPPVYRK
jgi:vancomycin resistance protein YoaR